jgi:hypothetical protein
MSFWIRHKIRRLLIPKNPILWEKKFFWPLQYLVNESWIMTLKVMTSAEEANGPKSLEKIVFILFNENQPTSTWFLLNMHKKINSPYCISSKVGRHTLLIGAFWHDHLIRDENMKTISLRSKWKALDGIFWVFEIHFNFMCRLHMKSLRPQKLKNTNCCNECKTSLKVLSNEN